MLLAYGPDSAARRILILPPLFDEMNRMRSTLNAAMRDLSDRGILSALPDLPGLNESLALLSKQSVTGWTEAAQDAAATIQATHVFSVRGGCLVDQINDRNGDPLLTLRLSPAKGQSLLSTLIRTKQAGDKAMGIATDRDSLVAKVAMIPVELAGFVLGADMWHTLEKAAPAQGANITEIKPQDCNGSTLWLRAEPQHDTTMAHGLAHQIDSWSARR